MASKAVKKLRAGAAKEPPPDDGVKCTVLDEVARIEKELGHKVTPAELVSRAEADPEGYPNLHASFEWDRDRAAHKYRLEQARKIIFRFRTVVTPVTVSFRVPTYLRDTKVGPQEQGMISVHEVLNHRERKAEVLRRELDRLRSFLRRVRDLAAAMGPEEEEMYFALLREMGARSGVSAVV